MRRRLVRLCPIFAAAGLVAFLFFSTLWNWAVERDYPKLRIRSAHPLAGLAAPRPAPMSLDAFLAGETQRTLSANLGQALPIFPISVRARNQLLYSLFGASGASSILVGKDQELYETFYIDEFCKRGAALDHDGIDEWAQSIRASQDAVEASAKSFVYLITPSKAAQYPKYFPRGLPCPALERGSTDKLSAFRAALDAHHVRYVDAASLIAKQMRNYPIDLFPRGGTHWNLLGAALGIREISNMLAASAHGSKIGRFDFTWRESPEAQGTDRDLLDLLNLSWPDAHYPTPAIAGVRNGDAPCERAPRLVAMGGSFVYEADVAFAHAPCPPEIDYWFYKRTGNGAYDLLRFHSAPGDVSIGERMAGGDAELRENLANADIVLLEENESNISLTKQVAKLRRALADAASRVGAER